MKRQSLFIVLVTWMTVESRTLPPTPLQQTNAVLFKWNSWVDSLERDIEAIVHNSKQVNNTGLADDRSNPSYEEDAVDLSSLTETKVVTIGSEIGSGAQGEILEVTLTRAVDRIPGTRAGTYAIKYTGGKVKKDGQIVEGDGECSFMKDLSHENILKSYGEVMVSYFGGASLEYCFMDDLRALCGGADLGNVPEEMDKTDLAKALQTNRHAASYLATRGYYHADSNGVNQWLCDDSKVIFLDMQLAFQQVDLDKRKKGEIDETFAESVAESFLDLQRNIIIAYLASNEEFEKIDPVYDVVEEWKEDIITNAYKNSGCITDPDTEFPIKRGTLRPSGSWQGCLAKQSESFIGEIDVGI